MNRSRSPGFSLFELLTALAIVAILATISIPAWQETLSRARRMDAITGLLQVQLAQERWRSEHAAYAADLGLLGRSSRDSPDGHYRLRVIAADATGFTVVARPYGPQRNDACGVFAVGAEGPLHAVGYAGPRCWNR